MKTLTLTLLTLLACDSDDTSQPTPPPEPPSESPSAQAETPPGCDTSDHSPGNFACASQVLCTSPNADDELTLNEFLCAANLAERSTAEGESVALSDVLAALPIRFRKNFTLKHGTREAGLRGHPQELMADVVGDAMAQNSQSADLDFPRAIFWDEVTGFSISYNGGLSTAGGNTRTQTSADRLDMLSYDPETTEFELWALPLPVQGELHPFQPNETDDNCLRCHGPRSRPIWPMYPDWPGFYGSDNDELTKGTPHQDTELGFLAYFRDCVIGGEVQESGECTSMQQRALSELRRRNPDLPEGEIAESDVVDGHRRYSNLFDAAIESHFGEIFEAADRDGIRSYLRDLDRLRPRVLRSVRTPEGLLAANGSEDELRSWMGLRLHPAWPYRPNHLEQSSEASRAFFHRPNLRLGVLYNRLVAKNLFTVIASDAVYRAQRKMVAFSLMDCSFGEEIDRQERALGQFQESAEARLETANMSLGDRRAADHRILYPALLASIGLQVRDVDIRYTYANRRFNKFDEGYDRPNLTSNIMALGYLRYRDNDYNRVNDAPWYFNSYFDGTATTNELLVAMILADLAGDEPAYAELFSARTLQAKYQRFTSRWELDEPFFQQMDELGGWIPLPFPEHVEDLHHRESFHKRIDGEQVFVEQHRRVCDALRADLGAP